MIHTVTFKDHPLQIAVLDDEIWFLGSSILTLLGGSSTDRHNIYRSFPPSLWRSTPKLRGVGRGNRRLLSIAGAKLAAQIYFYKHRQDFLEWVDNLVAPTPEYSLKVELIDMRKRLDMLIKML